jgi:hypothetical protein
MAPSVGDITQLQVINNTHFWTSAMEMPLKTCSGLI